MKAKIEKNIFLYKIFSVLLVTPFFVPVIVLFWKQKGLDMGDVFILQGIFALAVAFLEVPTGMIADQLGKKNSLYFACFLYAIGFFFYAFTSSFWGFLFWELVLALASSLFSGADTALLFDSLQKLGREEEFQQIEGEASSYRMIGFATTSLVGGFVGQYSLSFPFLLSAVGPFLALFVVWKMEEVQTVEKITRWKEGWENYKKLFYESARFVYKHQLVRWQILFFSFLGASNMWFFWGYQPYMKETGVPVWAFGVIFAGFNLFAAFASRQANTIEKRLGRKGTIVCLVLFQFLGPFLAVSFSFSLGFLFILFQQWNRGIFPPIIKSRILRYTYEDKRSTVLSMTSLASRLFFAISAPLLIWVGKKGTIYDSLWAQSFLILVLSLAFGWVYVRIPKKYFHVKERSKASSESTKVE